MHLFLTTHPPQHAQPKMYRKHTYSVTIEKLLINKSKNTQSSVQSLNDKLKRSTIIETKTTPLLNLDPLRHMLAERTEANSSRKRTKAKTSEKGFSRLEARQADRRLTKCEASCCSKPSTDKTKGVKFPLLSSTTER